MGRQQRKEDRQARKKTKISANQAHAKSSSGNSNSVGKQTGNVGFVFAKNQFASLVNKGKARQLQNIQRQQAAAQRQRLNGTTGAANQHDMEMDDSVTGAEGSAAAAARLRNEIAGAAASSNSQDFDSRNEYGASATADDDDPEAFFSKSGLQLDPTLTGRRDSSIKAYMRELRKVVDNADVLLEVVDARDPLGCRSLETERMLLRAGKKIVLILNKIDLVPKSNVEAWLKYLRHDFPTLAFKASTQSQRNNLSQGANAVNYSKASSAAASSGADVITGGSEAIGAGALLQLIKNYSRSLNLKTSIAVGVFGAPNVGKSSLINSLKRARVCSVASTPGHTKVVQSVMLDKSVRLLDCPGIVFSDESASGAAALGLSPEEIQIRRQSALLRNVVKVELVEDPITPVEAIMARVEAEHLMQVYGLEWFQEGDAQDLLMRIAVQRGRMARGGKIDIEGTARSVLHDWNVGRIKYYTHPPALHRSAILSDDGPAKGAGNNDALTKSIGGDNVSGGGEDIDATGGSGGGSINGLEKKLEQSSAILSGFSEAFDLAALLGEADAEVFGSGTGQSSTPLPEAPAPRFASMHPQEHQQEEIQDDHAAPVSPPISNSPTAAEAVEQAADTSRRSTLGKRSRFSSHSSSSDEDDSDADLSADDGDHRRGGGRFGASSALLSSRPRVSVPGLDSHPDDDDEDDAILNAEASTTDNHLLHNPNNAKSAWMDKLNAKATISVPKRTAELSLAFSAEELAQMAPSTGASRRKLKKMKKRADKAGAGLAGQFEHQRLVDETITTNATGSSGEATVKTGGVGGGMFGNISLPNHTKKAEPKRKGTGSMFDILMEGQNMADSDDDEEQEKEEEEEIVKAAAVVANNVADDYEEEL